MNLTKKEIFVGGLIALGFAISCLCLGVTSKQSHNPLTYLATNAIALLLGILVGSMGVLYLRNR